MNLTTLLDYVIPSSGVMMKHCNGGWEFYMTDEDFIKGESYFSQKPQENFHQFAERLIVKLMEDEKEKNDPEPLVTIDYAIYKNE